MPDRPMDKTVGMPSSRWVSSSFQWTVVVSNSVDQLGVATTSHCVAETDDGAERGLLQQHRRAE